jgi:hypothetical protein
VLQSSCTYSGITEGKVSVYSDCFKAIKTLQTNFQGITKHLIEESDLVMEATSLLQKLPLQVHLIWVKSHYTGPDRGLPHDLNEEAHSLANTFLYTSNEDYKPGPKVIDPPSQEVSIQFENYTLTKGLVTQAKFNFGAMSLQNTIMKQARWDDSTFHGVDWAAYDKAFSRLTKSRQMSIAKISHGLLNTNYQNHKYYGTSSMCPCCWDDIETLQHVFSCQHEEVSTHRTEQLHHLQHNLTTIQTPHLISAAIIHGISSWMEKEVGLIDSLHCTLSHSVVPAHMIITQAYNAQSQIGWDQLLRGRISKLWSQAAEFIAIKDGLQPDPTLASYVIASILTYSTSLWQFRCGVLHGHTLEETSRKQTDKLHQQIIQAYQDYKADPYVVSANERSIFTSRSLEERLKQGTDSLASWLRTYQGARKAQTLSTAFLAKSARTFFQPRTSQAPPDQPGEIVV